MWSTTTSRPVAGTPSTSPTCRTRLRLRCLVLDDPLAVPLGSEPVRIDGTIVGRVTSGNQGFRVGRAIAFAYLPADRADLGRRVDVEVFGEWIGAEVVKDSVYDPAGARIRA